MHHFSGVFAGLHYDYCYFLIEFQPINDWNKIKLLFLCNYFTQWNE